MTAEPWANGIEHNIGIVTGSTSNLVVIDVDEGGEETLAQLQQENGALPSTAEVRTKRGRHLYFKHPGIKIRNDVKKRLGPGLDVRGDGGFVVAAPSLHVSGARYEWVEGAAPWERQLADMPDWLLARLREPERAVSSNQPIPLANGSPRERRYAEKALSNASAAVASAPLHTRNDTLNREAFGIGQLVGAGLLAREEVEETLSDAAGAVGLPDREIRATLRSGLDAGQKEPRSVPVPESTNKTSDAVNQGRGLGLTNPEPWPVAVDGAELLAELVAAIKRFLILPSESAAVAIALWIAFTHAIEATDVAPILAILSPQKRCGKTTLIRMLSALVVRALAVSNITPSALFRTIEKAHPTLLIDEADSFMREDEQLRGILNAGHTRETAFVVRTVGDNHEPQRFDIFGAKAVAAIGSLPETIEDRSIVIKMRRKVPGEQVKRLAPAQIEELKSLCRKLARWSRDCVNELRTLDPRVPEKLNDRAADSWRSLFAIADAAGGEWPEKARRAALELSGDVSDDNEGPRIQLLADLRSFFRDRGNPERTATSGILEHLNSLDERPWPEYSHGRPLTARALGGLLKPFDCKSGKWKEDDKTIRGYERKSLEDAWSRYLAVEDFDETRPTGDESAPNGSPKPPLAPPAGNHSAISEDASATDEDTVAHSNGQFPESSQDGGGSGGIINPSAPGGRQ
jgi:hypothetical protein